MSDPDDDKQEERWVRIARSISNHNAHVSLQARFGRAGDPPVYLCEVCGLEGEYCECEEPDDAEEFA